MKQHKRKGEIFQADVSVNKDLLLHVYPRQRHKHLSAEKAILIPSKLGFASQCIDVDYYYPVGNTVQLILKPIWEEGMHACVHKGGKKAKQNCLQEVFMLH